MAQIRHQLAYNATVYVRCWHEADKLDGRCSIQLLTPARAHTSAAWRTEDAHLRADDRHIEVAVNEGWPAMAQHRLTLSTLPTALIEELHDALALKPVDDSQRAAFEIPALILLIIQASSANVLTPSDCEKDFQTSWDRMLAKLMSRAKRRCQYFYLTCLSYTDRATSRNALATRLSTAYAKPGGILGFLRDIRIFSVGD
jgi:hypothetical protein